MTSSPQKTPTEPGSVMIHSRRFGPINVREDQIILLTPGLLGFSQFNRYVLIEHGQEAPFLWLQSVDNPDLAFVVIDHLLVAPGYQTDQFTEVMQDLEVEKTEDLKIIVILTIPPGRPQDMTVNLMGPVAINLKNRRGRQLVMEDPRYSHKHRILPE